MPESPRFVIFEVVGSLAPVAVNRALVKAVWTESAVVVIGLGGDDEFHVQGSFYEILAKLDAGK